MLLLPDPAVDYMTFGGGRGMLHMLPRSDVLLSGGVFRSHDFPTHAETDETECIVGEHRRIFSDLG